jgi:hypothetical protein
MDCVLLVVLLTLTVFPDLFAEMVSAYLDVTLVRIVLNLLNVLEVCVPSVVPRTLIVFLDSVAVAAFVNLVADLIQNVSPKQLFVPTDFALPDAVVMGIAQLHQNVQTAFVIYDVLMMSTVETEAFALMDFVTLLAVDKDPTVDLDDAMQSLKLAFKL